MPSPPPQQPRDLLPPSQPRPTFSHEVFSREDGTGAQRQPTAAAGILIVEDDFLVVTQLEAALGDAGFVIAGIAASADEALELAARQRPALCVMDIRLAGGRDGIDAALELLRLHGIRCIFATAHFDQEVRSRAAAADPLGWLQKPYTMVSLVAVVRRALHILGANGH
jgi:DNA-binding NarL/FixJ family response regulator